MAKIATLVDDFTTQDNVKWTFGGNASVVAGQARINVNTGYNGFDGAGVSYDLVASAIYCQVIAPAGGTSRAVYIVLSDGLGPKVQIFCDGASWNAEWYGSGGGYIGGSYLSYSATTDAWWRIREVSGTIFFDSAPDGVTWTNRASVTTATVGLATTAVFINFLAGHFSGEAEPSYTYIDNVNTLGVTPSASPPPSRRRVPLGAFMR